MTPAYPGYEYVNGRYQPISGPEPYRTSSLMNIETEKVDRKDQDNEQWKGFFDGIKFNNLQTTIQKLSLDKIMDATGD